MTGLRTLLAGLICGLLFSGCAWMQTPTESSTFEFDYKIQEPSRTAHHATLGLTDEGYWAYFPEDYDEFSPLWTPGTLLELSAEDQGYLFAVVQAGQWGYRLQRLDTGRLGDKITGDLQPISADDVQDHQDLCWFESPSQFADSCSLDSAHRRWDLFDMQSSSGEQSLLVAGDFSDIRQTPGFPIGRSGVAGGDMLHSWSEILGPEASAPRLAIASAAPATPLQSATVVYDSRCEFSANDTAHVTYRAATFEESIGDHPLHIENAAVQYAADALVDCPDGTLRLLVPALTRPLLRGDDGRVFGPPTLGLVPRNLETLSPTQQRQWIQAGALLAVGDTQTASFWIEESTTAADPDDALSDLLLSSLPVLTSAGQPELALRLGAQLTSGAWNPENIPDYLDSHIVLLEHFGEREAFIDSTEHRQRLIKRRLDDHRAGWYRWAEVRLRLTQQGDTYGPAYRQAITEMEEDDLEQWVLAIYATLQMQGLDLPVVDRPDQLTARFEQAQATTLWDYLLADPEYSCGDQAACGVGAYGWTPLGPSAVSDEGIRRLETRPLLFGQRGFSPGAVRPHLESLADDAQQAAWWLAMGPLVADSERDALTTELVAQLREIFANDDRAICAARPQWRTRFLRAAHRIDAPSMTERQAQWQRFARWWSDRGVDAFCADAEQLLDATDALARHDNRWTSLVFGIVQDRLLAPSSTPVDPALFERSAGLARTLGDESTCANWNLGIAVAAARVGLFDSAENHLITATNCLQSGSDHRTSRNLVAAYIDFERAAGQHLVSDGRVENSLAQATRRRVDDGDICVGLLPIGFHLESQLPADLVAVADQVHLDIATDQAGTLQTASHLLDEARAAYLSGTRDLARGSLLSSARALDLARSNFRRTRHLPGLARIEFIDEIVFSGQLTEIVAAEEVDLPTASARIEQLRQGQVQTLLADLGDLNGLADSVDDPEVFAAVAAALIIEHREDDVDHYFSADSLPPSLCRP